MADEASNDVEVFVYTEGVAVPHDVVRVRVHPSVTVIPLCTFEYRDALVEIELCEGLLEIGLNAFYECVALKRITIPSTVTSIQEWAFYDCIGLEEIELCEGLVELGEGTFFIAKP